MVEMLYYNIELQHYIILHRKPPFWAVYGQKTRQRWMMTFLPEKFPKDGDNQLPKQQTRRAIASSIVEAFLAKQKRIM